MTKSMEDENTGVMSDPADEGDAMLRELDNEISKIKPEPVSEDVKTPSEPVAQKPVQKFVPYERFAEKVKEVNSLKEKNIQGSSPMEVVKLAKALEGHTEDEIDFITRNAKSSKIDDIITASKDEMVRLAIDAKRKQESSKKKVPDASSPEFASRELSWKDIQSKFGTDQKGKEEFRKYAEQQEQRGRQVM